MKPTIRTRIAPSPTGFVHIGSLRTALYNYLYARQNGGEFVVRIEDTDRTRLVPGAVEQALEMFAWAGLDWDEGPTIITNGESRTPSGSHEVAQVGDYGPYVQSERLALYKQYADELVKKGTAYPCFCTAEDLQNMRAEQQARKERPHYDGRCLRLPPAEVRQRLANGESHVIRLNVPEGETVTFSDVVYGDISVGSAEIDHQVLVKSDGFPTYHLAVVVDDHLMGITHIMRGEEWLPSTPKHVLLYQAFEWEAPQYCHLPNILGENKKKLSKRTGDVAVGDFRAKGYLPEALINYVALLGWNPGTNREFFTLKELVAEFDIRKIHKAGAVFDWKKLDNINGHYIRQLDSERLYQLCLPFLEDAYGGRLHFYEPAYIRKAIVVEQERMKRISDVVPGTELFFTDTLHYEKELLYWKKTLQNDPAEVDMITAEVLREVKKILEEIKESKWDAEHLQKRIFSYIQDEEMTNGEVLWPLRIALSGQQHSPGPFEIMAVLGKETSLARIQAAISRLG